MGNYGRNIWRMRANEFGTIGSFVSLYRHGVDRRQLLFSKERIFDAARDGYRLFDGVLPV